jgi:hypothetical protein
MMMRTAAIGPTLAILVAILLAWPGHAYNRYNDGCNICHGEFTDGTSPQGTMFPGDDKHLMHRGSSHMDADCSLCHSEGDDRNPFIGFSDGTATNPGVGCTGCHGRDYGGSIGNSGIGLRRHHVNAGVSCSPCHDGDPNMVLPENVKPTYYGTIDSNVDDPCNSDPDFLENWSIGDTQGLDNDGDLLYDGDDPDCAASCVGDVNGDLVVDTADLVALLAAWGPCPGCDEDINGDDVVDTADLVALLAAWGPC